MALDRHEAAQGADHPCIRWQAQGLARVLTRQLQSLGLGNVDSVGDVGGVLTGEAAVEVYQVVLDRFGHPDKAPRRADPALGLTPTVTTGVLAKAVGDADAQRDLQPAVERQHHVHRLEAVTDDHVELLLAAVLVDLPHGAKANALEGLFRQLEIMGVLGHAQGLAGQRAPTEKSGGHLEALSRQGFDDLLTQVREVMGLDVVVRL